MEKTIGFPFKTKKKFIVFILTASLFLGMGVVDRANAAIITFDISGTIASTNGGFLFGSKSISDSWSGSFTVDDTALPISDNGNSAVYVGSGVSNFALIIEGMSYSISHVVVNYNYGTVDYFSIYTNLGAGLVLNGGTDIFATGAILNNYDAISFNHEIVNYTGNTGTDIGTINSITKTPEPSTMLLLGSGLLGLVGYGRRRLKK